MNEKEFAIAQISSLFLALTSRQKAQLSQLGDLYLEWNSKINLISRKDINNIYPHHILHSVGVVSLIRFAPSTRIMDAGTGGGFPGIPLAILFPECHFYLVDSIKKKIAVCQDIVGQLGLANVTCVNSRVESCNCPCHFVVSRAAMPLQQLVDYTKKWILRDSFNALPNGLLALKGGNLEGEIAFAKNKVMVEPLEQLFPMPYYEDKKVVYLPIVGFKN